LDWHWFSCSPPPVTGYTRSAAAHRIAAGALVFFLSLALMAHLIPGLVTAPVAVAYQVSPDAVPYDLKANLDKVFVGFFLLAFGHSLISALSEWRRMVSAMALLAVTTLAVVMSLALLLGYVTLDLKWTNFFFIWAWKNLFYTCVAEEAFFRGFLQRQLARALTPFRFGVCASVLIAALLFGLAHYAGGTVYVVLATVAGIGYGWVYQHTGRIEASILTHFLLNCAHFLLFTYPALS
jgi:membrane protease YdiL (CAAX protease family)